MAGNTKDAWHEVGDRFTEWSRKLAEHYRETDRVRGGSGPEEDRRKLEEAVQAAMRQLDVAFTSLGETLRDPEAKQRLGNAARALRDAMVTTVSETGERIRRRTGSEGPERPETREPPGAGAPEPPTSADPPGSPGPHDPTS